MAYVPVPKDLTKVKTKIAFNLTKRQLICFSIGVLYRQEKLDEEVYKIVYRTKKTSKRKQTSNKRKIE